MADYSQVYNSPLESTDEAMNYFWMRNAKVQVTNSAGETLEYDSKDFYIEFNVNKTLKTSETGTNESSVSLYNLSKENRDKIFAEGSKYVVLYAGYKNVVILSGGDITEVVNEKNGQDVITTMYFTDGGNAFRESDVNVSYQEGTPVSTVINDVAKTMPLDGYNIQDVPDYRLKTPQTYSGKSNKALKDLCDTHGLDYTINNNTMNINKTDGYNGGSVYLLNSDSGLVGSPQKIKKNKKKKSGGEDNTTGAAQPSSPAVSDTADYSEDSTDKGWRVTCLLQPYINCGDAVKVESIFINGFFKVKEIVHSGSASRDGGVGTFYSELTVDEIK